MNEEILVQQLNHDLDSILEGKTPQTNEDVSQEYMELLKVAGILVETDFYSEQSGASLRQQVLEGKRKNNSLNKEALMNRIFGNRRPALVLASAAAVTVLAIGLAFPGTMVAMANNTVDNIAKVLKIGKYTSVIQIDDSANRFTEDGLEVQEFTINADSDGQVIVSREIIPPSSGEEGGLIAIESKEGKGGEQADLVNYSSIEEAQKAASFQIIGPEHLPGGYSFKEAQSYEGSKDYMNLYYSGAGKDIIMMQRTMNEQTQLTLATDGSVEQLDINGVVGAWIEPHTLMWEKDGVNYSLYCPGFSQEEALKIVSSMK